MGLLRLRAGPGLGGVGRRRVVRIRILGGERRQLGGRAVGVDSLGDRSAREGGEARRGIGGADGGRDRSRDDRGFGDHWGRRGDTTPGRPGLPDGPVLAPAASRIASRSRITALPSLSATVCGPKLTRRIPSFGISHSPAISWLAISGTLIETVLSSSVFEEVAVVQHEDAGANVSRLAWTTPSFSQAQSLGVAAFAVPIPWLITSDTRLAGFSCTVKYRMCFPGNGANNALTSANQPDWNSALMSALILAGSMGWSIRLRSLALIFSAEIVVLPSNRISETTPWGRFVRHRDRQEG